MPAGAPPAVEVCVDTLPAATAAIDAGAKRLELCSRLDLDGLTPDPAVVAALADRGTPLQVMLRPRADDFVLTGADKDAVLASLAEFAGRPAVSGFVVGALLPGRTALDAPFLEAVAAAARQAQPDAHLTFHRAFDVLLRGLAFSPLADAAHPAVDALATLDKLGFASVLTSGGPPTVDEGAPCLERLAALARERGLKISILPGGGVRAHNAVGIAEQTGSAWVHSSKAEVAAALRSVGQ